MYRNEDRTGTLEEFKKADKQDGGQHIRDADGPGAELPYHISSTGQGTIVQAVLTLRERRAMTAVTLNPTDSPKERWKNQLSRVRSREKAKAGKLSDG
jgi:hypothetical protein